MRSEKWTAEVGLSVSVLSIKELNAIVAGCHGSVILLDESTGRVLWYRDLGTGTFPGMVTLQWLASQGRGGLILAGCNGFAFGLEVSRGEVTWKTDVPGTRYQCLALLVHEQYVFCGSYGKVIKLDANNGRVLWKCKIKSSIKCHVTLAVHTEHNALLMGTHGRLAHLHLESGDIRWQIKVPKLKGDYVTQPTIAIDNDRVFCFSGSFLISVDVVTGDATWQRDLTCLGNDNASIAIHRNRLFVATSCHVMAFETTGESIWCRHLPSLRQYMPSLLAETTTETLLVAGGGFACALSMVNGDLEGRDADLAELSGLRRDQLSASVASLSSVHTANDPHGSPSAQVAAILCDLQQFGRRDVSLGRVDMTAHIGSSMLQLFCK